MNEKSKKKSTPKKKAPVKKAATKKKKAPNKGGRPTKYKPEFDEQALKLCKLGAIDADLADFFKVTEQTVNNWKLDFPKFFESIKKGKDVFDTEIVETALVRRAIGYEHSETKFFQAGGSIITRDTIKQYPPDTAALIFFLKNRNPARWRDKQDLDLTSGGEPIRSISPHEFVKGGE